MRSDDDDLPPGFPGGHVPIVGTISGDADDDEAHLYDGNGGGDPEGYRAAFGRHPMADWKPTIRRRRRRR